MHRVGEIEELIQTNMKEINDARLTILANRGIPLIRLLNQEIETIFFIFFKQNGIVDIGLGKVISRWEQ